MTTRPPLAGCPHHRVLDARPGRHHHHARRPRRRRDQGRAAAGRLHPADDVADRRGHLAAAPPPQPRQAQRSSSTCAPTRASQTYKDLVRRRRRGHRGHAPGRPRAPRPRLRRPQGGQPADRVLHHLRLRHDRPLQGHAEPRHRLRHLGRHREARASTTRASATSPSTCRSASTPARSTARSASWPASPRPAPPGEGCRLEIAQSDAAAAFDWLPHRDLEGLRAAAVRGHRQRVRRLRAPRARHGRHARRRALPDLRDRPTTATCCSWPPSRSSGRTSARASAGPSCSSSGPASKYADHARGNRELQAELRDIFHTQDGRRVARLRRRGQHADRPGQHARQTIARRPAVPGPPAVDRPRRARAPTSCPRRSRSSAASCRTPTKAPTVGQHTDEVLRDVLGYDDARIAALRDAGAIG